MAYTARDVGLCRWPHWPGGSSSWPYIAAAQDLLGFFFLCLPRSQLSLESTRTAGDSDFEAKGKAERMELIRPLARGNGWRLLGASLWCTARMMMFLETLKVSHHG